MMRSPRRSIIAFLPLPLPLMAMLAHAQQPVEDRRSLSPAQTALFMTPQLRNVDKPETLQYRYTRTGKDGFQDTVLERIVAIHQDGTKEVGFTYLSGDHHKFFPTVDNFAGNPLLMVFLESDVQTMKDTIGVSATYFRNTIREAMVDQAKMMDITYTVGGIAVPAHEVTVQPFAKVERLEHLPSVQAKLYRFVLTDAVPGGLAVLQTSMPADAEGGIAASGERLEFDSVVP